MDRRMDDGRNTRWVKGTPFFRADYRRAIDGVIDYFGDSPAWALSPQRRIGESESAARYSRLLEAAAASSGRDARTVQVDSR
jgi:hypothetical protein